LPSSLKFAALVASHGIEPSGERVALATGITTFDTALDSHAKSHSEGKNWTQNR